MQTVFIKQQYWITEFIKAILFKTKYYYTKMSALINRGEIRASKRFSMFFIVVLIYFLCNSKKIQVNFSNGNQNDCSNYYQNCFLLQGRKSLTSAYNYYKLMYPFYFPFESSYFMNPYSPYYSDPNQLFQYFSMNQDIKQQEQSHKNQEINTNYSINDCLKKNGDHAQNLVPPQQNPCFFHNQSPNKNNAQQNPRHITKSNEFKQQKIFAKPSQPKFRYTHKNFESNIINKIFSFLWSQDKSKRYVGKILEDKTKVALFFDYIKMIRKYCKRYINKEYLMNLCDYKIEHIAYKIVMKQTEKLKYLTLEEFSLTVRKLIFIYLDTVCTTSILTSKKMRTDIWKEHFEKMRNIKDFLFGKLTSEEYDLRMSCSYREIYGSDQQKCAIDA